MAIWTDADLVNIRAAIASGVRSITFADGRKTEYQSLDHMIAAEKVIAASLMMQSVSKSSVIRRRTPYYKSGLR
ncbi:hypothetical protein HNP52_000338 [Sphingomonas kyeonggiensis]|uniref:Uncharacterized protein n=1 Tax=Sphingomonas kyeonggiensis TaxID=1268553 RepID=A0A7W7NR00_9SPHN|nr:hypothetical protein [Sphingomonas kyeonggiensis]MBB4837287.1 hypothetical protein [Sphingomonas kyeonggiensis]